MTDKDLYKLCDLLQLKPGGGVFTSYMFLKYISNHAPHKCKKRIVNSIHLMRYRQDKIKGSEKPWKIYFKGWNDSGSLKITNLDRLIFTKNGEFTI